MKKFYLIRVYTEGDSIHSFVLFTNSLLDAYTEFIEIFRDININFEITSITETSL